MKPDRTTDLPDRHRGSGIIVAGFARCSGTNPLGNRPLGG